MEFCEMSEEYELSDEELEALSFCDLVAERETLDRNGISVFRDSNTENEDLDFEFGSFTSAATHHSCPADDLFHQGRLLPLTVQRSWSQSDAKIASSKSNENRIMLNEKLQAWRIDPLDSAQRMDFSEKNSHYCCNSATPSGKTKSKDNRSSSTLPKAATSKTSLKWQQFFTLGLMKTPPMKLEDMRLRQGKTSTNNGVDNSLKRSVSCNYEEVTEKESVKFQRKSRSVKENMWVEERQPRSKGWKILAPLTSLNSCKASSNSVINCSTAKKRVDSRGLAEEKSASTKKPPVYADQNSINFGSRFSKMAKAGGGGGANRNKDSRVEFRRLSFHNGSYPKATLQGV